MKSHRNNIITYTMNCVCLFIFLFSLEFLPLCSVVSTHCLMSKLYDTVNKTHIIDTNAIYRPHKDLNFVKYQFVAPLEKQKEQYIPFSINYRHFTFAYF